MPDELKVGDVVLVECCCHSCSVFGPPDPSEKNGPYIITAIHGDTGFVDAKAPFGIAELKHWNMKALGGPGVKFKVVARADDAA